MSIMPYPPGQDPRTAFLSRPRPDWPDEEPDPDAVVDQLRWRWRQGSFPPPVPGFDLAGGVGRGTRNARADVARLETLLHRAGHYDVSGTGGPTGYFGPPQEDAIRAYQKARGLTVDGLVLPNGETMAALGNEIGATPQPPAGNDDQSPANRAPGDQVVVLPLLPAVGAVIADTAPIWGPPAAAGAYWLGQKLSEAYRSPPSAPASTAPAPKGLAKRQERERQRQEARRSPDMPRGINLLEMPNSSSATPGENLSLAKPTPPLPGFVPPEMNIPPHTGGPPPKMPDTSIVSGPGTPMPVERLPPTARPETKPEDFIEIYPDQSDDFSHPTILEANQSEETKRRITGLLERVKKGGGPNTTIKAGGYDEFNKYRPERALLDKKQKGANGAVYADGEIHDPDLDITIYVQDANVYADGRGPKPREADAAGRLYRLAPGERKYVVVFPKPRPGQTLNNEATDEFIADIWARAKADVKQMQPEYKNNYNPRQKPKDGPDMPMPDKPTK